MILTKKDLQFYIMADRIINGFSPNRTIFQKIKDIMNDYFGCHYIIDFLRIMRLYAYYVNTYKEKPTLMKRIKCLYYHRKYHKISVKFGYTIGENVFDYGLCIPHYGTIVVNPHIICGKYAVLFTSTCIAGANKIIGDGLYLSTGATICGNVILGNNVSVSSNSMVNKSYCDNVLLGGVPASVKRENYPPWYERDGIVFHDRVELIEKLHKNFNGE